MMDWGMNQPAASNSSERYLNDTTTTWRQCIQFLTYPK